MKSYNPEIWTALFRGVSFFDILSDDDIVELLEAGGIVRYDFHEYIIKEGDEDNKRGRGQKEERPVVSGKR